MASQMSEYQMFAVTEDLTPFVSCQKRSNARSERALYVPLAKRLQLSGENADSFCKDGESFFTEGLFTPFSNNSLFDQKLQSLEVDNQFQPTFGQQGKLTEQCFSELIKSGLKLPSITNRDHSSYLSESVHALDYTNFENNNTTSSYFDSGFYDCGKESTADNANRLATIGGEIKSGGYGVNVKGGTRSYEDFKSKDFRTKIERNFSSPVLSSQSPVTDCGRLSVGSNPAITKTNHPILDCASCQPDAEDLEVAMINESFEEQQKQSKIFETAAMKNYLYNQTNKRTDNAEFCSDLESTLGNMSTEEKGSHERMPYTVAISNNKKLDIYKENKAALQEQFQSSMTTSLTLSEDGGHVQKTELSNVSDSEVGGLQSSQTYDTLFHQASLGADGCSRSLYEEEDEQKLSDFDVEEMILDDAALRRAAQTLSSGRYNLTEPLSEPILTESRRDFVKAKKKRSASDAIPIADKKQVQFLGSADEKLDAAAALALNVVESLFVGGNSLDHSSPLLFPGSVTDGSKDDESRDTSKVSLHDDDVLAPAVKNVFDAYRSTSKQNELAANDSDCVSPDVDPEILKAIQEVALNKLASPKLKQDDTAVVPSSDSAVDSWEELDSDDSKLVDEIQSAMGKVRIRKPKIDYFAPPETNDTDWNEKELPNVLEAYGLPSRISYDDVKHELAKIDCADVIFQRVDDSHCLIAFSSANAALKALIAARQRSSCPWLRLRTMCDASAGAQEKARLCSTTLKPYKPRPQTTTVVARRLVENALGKRSNISVEQRRAERKKLIDAREQKEARAALWEDNS